MKGKNEDQYQKLSSIADEHATTRENETSYFEEDIDDGEDIMKSINCLLDQGTYLVPPVYKSHIELNDEISAAATGKAQIAGKDLRV